jgi:putative adhesin
MLGTLVLAMMAVTATDQTVQVSKGTKLDVNNFAGDVLIKVWDRDAVRVEATHSDRETVDIKQGDQTVSIRSRSARGGPPRSLDYNITVPSWMGISVNGNYAFVTMEGVGGDVNVETTRGDINVRGGSGFVSLKSVQGEVTLEKAKGRIEVRAVNEGIRLADINGDLSAESTNGSIILDRIDSGNVDLYTVNGNISYDGPIKDKGLYRLTTHNGLIAMAIPERVNAALTVRTYNGGFRSTFPIGGDPGERRKRFAVTLGNGSAHVELESFGGTISLRRPGEPRPETERRRRPERQRDKDQLHGADHALADLIDVDVAEDIRLAMIDVQPEIDLAVAEAMAELGVAAPDVHITPMPTPTPTPRPRLQRR